MKVPDPSETAPPVAEFARSMVTGTARHVPALQDATEWLDAFRRSVTELEARTREFGAESPITARADEDALVNGYCFALSFLDAVREFGGHE